MAVAKVTSGWIGVDLDGTLAYHSDGIFPEIGAPLMPMVERVRLFLLLRRRT